MNDSMPTASNGGDEFRKQGTGRIPRSLRRFLHGVHNARFVLLGVAALAVTVTGWVGWLESDPTLSVADALYWSLALFTLNAPENPATVALALELARWGAILVAATTLTTLASAARDTLTEFGVRKRIKDAHRLKQHKVVFGDGLEIARLASSYRTNRPAPDVVAIGDIPAVEEPELRRSGAIVLSGVNDTDLAPILRDASRVIVVGRTDSSTMAMAARIERVQGDSPLLTVLVDDRDLAAQWNRTKISRSVSRSVRVAMELLRRHSPLPEGMVVPPPIVIGDSPIAGEIARRITVGWQEPGERLEVHLVGFSTAALEAVSFGLEARGDFRRWDMAPYPDLAPGIVRSIIAGHRFANLENDDRLTLSGPRVYVAYEDDARTVTVAAAVAAAITNAEVVGVVADGGTWSSGTVIGKDATLVSSDQLLTQHSTIEKTAHALLAEEIQSEAERTHAGAATGFGALLTSGAQESISETIADLLSSVGLELDARVWPARTAPLLGPDELNILADAVSRKLSVPMRQERRDQLRFAARLPTLAARAGHTPDWISDHPVILTSEDLEKLAKAAHQAYEEVSRTTRNATASENAGTAWEDLPPLEVRSNYAQAADIPLKLALCSLTWARRTDTGGQPFRFSPAEEELLAEVEHERWCEFMIRNGRPGTIWNVPWSALKEEERDYDRQPVRAIPDALLRIGIEIVRPVKRSSSESENLSR